MHILIAAHLMAHALLTAGAAQEPFRVETTLVGVPVIVTDDQGRYVPGLGIEDFRLYQDDRSVRIDVFAASEEPLKVALLLDTSKSTVPVLDKIKKAARRFLSQMRPQDQAMVVSFDYEIKVLNRLTADRKRLEEGIKSARLGSAPGTKLHDAVSEVMTRWFRSIRGRKAIVLLTDGQDYGSSLLAEELLAAAAESDTVIYPIFYLVDPADVMKKLFDVSPRVTRPSARDTGVLGERDSKALAFLTALSERSAGRVYRSEVTDLEQTFEKIAEELRHQYLLGFYPDAAELDGELHTLRVEVSRPGFSVRERKSYRIRHSNPP